MRLEYLLLRRKAMSKQAKGIIMIHNHPSEVLEPSEKDKDFWRVVMVYIKIHHFLNRKT